MIKLVNFLAKTVFNVILLCFIIMGTYFTLNLSQSAPGIRPMSGKQLRELSKYMRPLKTVYGKRYCSSSSISYKGKSYTLTNMHCCEAINEFEPSLRRVGDVLEKILYVSDKSDVCILTSTIKSPITLAKKELQQFDPVLLFGYPMGGPLTPRFGHTILLNIDVTVDYGMYVLVRPSNYISTLTFPGNSGSPVFNAKGEVVNLLYAGPNPLFMYGVTVPLDQIKQAFEDMLIYVK